MRLVGGAMSYLALDTVEDLQRLARLSHANILIVGDMAVSERDEVLRTLRQQRGHDVFHAQRPSELVLPDRGDVILVLDDACELSRFDQHRLLGWMGRNRGRIVSFASRSLYGMVCEGRFVERLYYKLNMFCVMLTD
jgi:sigma-54-interacting transcriptional regulator